MVCLTPAGAESSFVIAAACCQSGSIVRTLFKSKVHQDLVQSIILSKVQKAQSKHCPNLPWINLWLDLDWISRNHPTNHSTGAPKLLRWTHVNFWVREGKNPPRKYFSYSISYFNVSAKKGRKHLIALSGSQKEHRTFRPLAVDY